VAAPKRHQAPFLDTNVFLRHLLQDNPQQSPRCTAFFARVEEGAVAVRISEAVIFEVVFVMERRHKHAKSSIRNAFLPLIELPGVVMPGKRLFREAFDSYVDLNISFIDAYHAALMRGLGTTQVLSFDTDFDRVLGVERIEP